MSNKHRQWAGALARDCGITMTTQTQAAHINGEIKQPNRRRYFRLPDDVRAGIRSAYIGGKPIEQITRDLDASEATIYTATADLPKRQAWRNAQPATPAPPEPPKDGRPVREAGESKQHYAARIVAWKCAADPAYRARVLANRSEGVRRGHRLRQLAKQRAEAKIKRLEEALKAAKSAPPPDPAPVAATEPPWGFTPPAPVEMPPPRPGFWRSVGMMLGLVRAP
jgi:hypothetical protein